MQDAPGSDELGAFPRVPASLALPGRIRRLRWLHSDRNPEREIRSRPSLRRLRPHAPHTSPHTSGTREACRGQLWSPAPRSRDRTSCSDTRRAAFSPLDISRQPNEGGRELSHPGLMHEAVAGFRPRCPGRGPRLPRVFVRLNGALPSHAQSERRKRALLGTVVSSPSHRRSVQPLSKSDRISSLE